MKIMVACEYSGVVREAFARKGHDAWSCDLLQTEQPGHHIVIDNDAHLKDVLYNRHWDMIIGHPPCTRLCNSVSWYIKQNNLYDEVERAAVFFNMILNAPAKRICVENPIQHGHARRLIPRYDQIIQPYNFGEDASKATCLWLKNLPKLINTSKFPPRQISYGGKFVFRWGNQTDGGFNKLSPSADRGKLRSRTYQGIADAMADQWSYGRKTPVMSQAELFCNQ
jgi:hypothetical protein